MEFTLHPQLAKDSYILGNFSLSQLLLINDSQFPWFILVPRKVAITEVFQLDSNSQQQLWSESSHLSETVMNLFKGDKLNVAAIGNLVPQLHLHHIVRYKADPLWPSPIWGKLPMVAYDFEVVLQIQEKLGRGLQDFEPLTVQKKS
ncbi:HIT domain-containing protein [Aliikangiella marina]|uniref:HIT domain-containing protein n=1 Tax=Aliikangiella marina TaxID=1712262 RepID=A0A545TCD3_9GAMM|nr:HIT domain-containing protein [Aliikangiella marina]TQV74878.1 HIT domain-containing protein [Aliikangiella marina]